MSRLSIKMRVLVALMVPTSAILMLCGFLIMQQNARSQQLTAADQIVGMLPAIVNVAHAMQVERGNSAGLIASDRAGSFQTRVAEARGKTDGLLATLTEKEAQVEKETLDDLNRAAIAQMAQEISKLRAIREGVDTNFSVAQAVAAYTQIVRSIQDRVASIHSLMPAQELAGDIETISAILQLVEYSGLERAVGAVGFATGSFSPEVFARFIGLGERQIPELDLIEKNASAALSKQLADALSTPSAAKVDQRRMAVRENMGQVGTEYVSGQQWFSEATDRIASLIDVESQAIATVQANLKRHHDILSAEIWTQTAILCGLLTAVGVMGFFTVRSIVNPLARLKVSVEKLSNGEQVEVPFADQNNEIGSLARSTGKINDLMLEFQQIAVALDNGSSALMTDENLTISYINPKLESQILQSEAYFKNRMGTEAGLRGRKLDLLDEASQLRGALTSITGSTPIDVVFDGRIFVGVAAPVVAAGKKTGYVFEFSEETSQRALETQIGTILAAAREGDYSQRLDVHSSRPFMKLLVSGINEICANVQDFLQELDQSLAAAAKGDLTKMVGERYDNQLGALAKSTNATISSLSELVAGITLRAGEVQEESQGISTTSNQLFERAESQAATLLETSTAMQNMTEGVKINENRVLEALEGTKAAASDAEAGRDMIESAVKAVSLIKASTDRIAEFTAVIDNIAFQTNLLALNAAVEAARAGDAGKGFAVVASEVRTLAQRATEASSAIGSVISESSSQVDNGVNLVDQTGKTLVQLLDAVQDNARLMSEIELTIREQNGGIVEMNEALRQLEQITQENTGLAERSADSVRRLSVQANELGTSAGLFVTAQSSVASTGTKAVA